MPMRFMNDTPRDAQSWAEVRARDQVVRYRRSGVGRGLVLLLRSDRPESLWPELLDALEVGFRLIVPEPPPGDADVAAWLAGFLEGLGVPQIGIVATDRFCIPVLETALLEPDQIAGLVFVSEGDGQADPALRGVLETGPGRAVPLLVVRRGQPGEAVQAAVKTFLGTKEIAPLA